MKARFGKHDWYQVKPADMVTIEKDGTTLMAPAALVFGLLQRCPPGAYMGGKPTGWPKRTVRKADGSKETIYGPESKG